MKRVISSIYGLFLLFAPVQPINAQVLDGETAQEASFSSSGGLSLMKPIKTKLCLMKCSETTRKFEKMLKIWETLRIRLKRLPKNKANRGDGSVRTSRRHSQAFKRRYAYRSQQRQL